MIGWFIKSKLILRQLIHSTSSGFRQINNITTQTSQNHFLSLVTTLDPVVKF